MDFIEIVFILLFATGITYTLYIIGKDPVLLLKSLLRMTSPGKAAPFVSLFIWGPARLIDKIFKLKIFIDEFEDASSPKTVIYKDFEKYILISSKNQNYIESLLSNFNKSRNSRLFKLKLELSEIEIASYEKYILLRIGERITQETLVEISNHIDSNAPINMSFQTTIILINRFNKSESFFLYHNHTLLLKLIGRDFSQQKIYINMYNDYTPNTIFYNSNIEDVRHFNIEKMQSNIYRLKFARIKAHHPSAV